MKHILFLKLVERGGFLFEAKLQGPKSALKMCAFKYTQDSVVQLTRFLGLVGRVYLYVWGASHP